MIVMSPGSAIPALSQCALTLEPLMEKGTGCK